ncbi:TonB-dependent receptor [Sphingomonas sp. RHCKR7]|uniref:TonB-dependent receptor domain-containing protein n=1 Tax=Sphingomonas folli TaxID=2862497 RepID=UPI001CA4F159|nr:TonB-dependent receptor [Sphingomonas folli]MBW6525973.1 TonB-dependent receptor [Sphingomonas folli]
MKLFRSLLIASAVSALSAPAVAGGMTPPAADMPPADLPPADTTRAAGDDTVSTGVARARDRLDSATSTSVLREDEIERLGARGVGDLLRDVPGLRSTAGAGEGYNSLTVRGLPLASSGAKFIQIQEDGLPVLEFGDMIGLSGDGLVRPDLMLSQVEVIRGGSASTFASNSPGGVVNFRTKTGEVEGGSVAFTAGLDYDSSRADFTYGGHLSDSLRFQLGGFYRQGEGPRRTGYDAQKGGQVRLNVTRDLTTGYVRVYGKYLSDRTPYYDAVPFWFGGTNAAPRFTGIGGFDELHDSLGSRYLRTFTFLDRSNRPMTVDLADGQHVRESSLGIETSFEVSGWTVIERLRYAAISGGLTSPFNTLFGLPRFAAVGLGGAGATLAYANGPSAGAAIPLVSAAPLNGNGLIRAMSLLDMPVNDYGDVTNEVRVSRVFDLGAGELTTTAGLYAARQRVDRDLAWVLVSTDLRGDGRSAAVDVFAADGTPLTERGVLAYGNVASYFGNGRPGRLRRSVVTDNAINAPFASLNYHVGQLSIGGSLRYDVGGARGQMWGSDLGGGRVGLGQVDVNGDGTISGPERVVELTAYDRPAPVDYTYHYLSYSAGVTYRPAEPLAVFARYSKGARTGADRLLFTPAISTSDGSIVRGSMLRRSGGKAIDPAVNAVRQAEAGAKYRTDRLTLNLTGFWATTTDTNFDAIRARSILRDYEAKGLEFEGGVRLGVLGLNGGATYTRATIRHDYLDPSLDGNRPRFQPKLIFQATPEIVTDRVALGAVFIGSTQSFAQDENRLVAPGFVTTNAFAQWRATERLKVTVNANNLFNRLAFEGIDNPTSPDGTIISFVRGRPLTGRTISATLRLDF